MDDFLYIHIKNQKLSKEMLIQHINGTWKWSLLCKAISKYKAGYTVIHAVIKVLVATKIGWYIITKVLIDNN